MTNQSKVEASRRMLLAAGAATFVGAQPAFAQSRPAPAEGSGGFSPDGLESIATPGRNAVNSGDAPGVISMVWRKGELAHVGVLGSRDLERKLPMERTTIMGIASMTKPVTVATALILVDAGLMKLADPITRWAPEFANMRVLRRLDGPLDDTVPAPRVITIQDLMTHRSGLVYGFMGATPLHAALMQKFGMGIDTPLSPDEWVKALAAMPLAYAPGERFSYGQSTDLLGIIVGRAAGKGLQQAMADRVFGPLGMTDTGFWIPPAKRERAAVIYSAGSRAGEFTTSPGPLAFVGAAPQAYASGGQGLVSTADDYLTFARMLMRAGEVDGVRLLKPETARLMNTDWLTPAQRQAPSGIPGLSWKTQGFGLGVSVITDAQAYVASGRGAGSGGAFGWGGAFGGLWQADPAEDLIALWLIQALPNAVPAPGAIPRVPGLFPQIDFNKRIYAALKQ